MKRLLCIIASMNVGGAETFMMKLYRNLNRDEYQMDFAVCAEGAYDKEITALGGRIFRLPLRRKHPIKSFAAIKRLVKKEKYTYVLKLGDPPVCVTDLIAAKLGGAKVLAMRSCNAPTNLSVLRRLCDALCRPIMNCVCTAKIAPSDLAANYTFGPRAVSKGTVTLLHNAVDLRVYKYSDEDRERIRRELSLVDSFVVGHVGRFAKQKNHAFLLRVFAAIKRKRPNAKLLLVGKGELESALRAQADELGLTDAIVFTGTRSDVPALLSAMDVFVFPSFHEGMPNTVIEAQATGLPCVIADTITREANVTGLVTYLPLSVSEDTWADEAIAAARDVRANTHESFYAAGYDIDSSTKTFLEKVLEEG